METILPTILMAAAGIFILWLIIKLFLTPIKWIVKLLINTAIGFAGLWVLNYFGAFFGISLGLNWIKLGLEDVLYDPKTNTVYTPNTNQTAVMGKLQLSGAQDTEETPDEGS